MIKQIQKLNINTTIQNSLKKQDLKNFFTLHLKVDHNIIYFQHVDTLISFNELGNKISQRGNAGKLPPNLQNNLLTNCNKLKNKLGFYFIGQKNIINFLNINKNISILLFNLDENNKIITENINNFYLYISEGSFGANPKLYTLNDFLNIINGLTPTLHLDFFTDIKTITCKNPINSNRNHSEKLKEIINYYLTKERCGVAKIIRKVHYNDKIIIFEKDDNVISTKVNRILFNIDMINDLANIEGYISLFSYNKLYSLYQILQTKNIYNIDGSINKDLLLNICDDILYPQIIENLYGGSKKLKDCTVLQLRKLMKKHKKSCYKDGKALKKSSMIRILQKC